MTVYRPRPVVDFYLFGTPLSGARRSYQVTISPWPTESEAAKILQDVRDWLSRQPVPDHMIEADLYGEPELVQPARMHPDDLTA